MDFDRYTDPETDRSSVLVKGFGSFGQEDQAVLTLYALDMKFADDGSLVERSMK